MPQLRLALAQVNATVGDLVGNADLVVEHCKAAVDQGVHLVVFPEMMLTGYPLEDLAMRLSLIEASKAGIEALAVRLKDEGCGDLVAMVGYLDQKPDVLDAPGIPKNAPQNNVAVIHDGAIVARQAKHHLWNYGVGDEIRNFVAGDTINVVQIGGIDVALAICEDLWRDGPSAAAKAADAALLVVPNGSPYEADKDDVRLALCARRAAEGDCVLAYVNLVGGQDELVFDGDSIVVDASGTVLGRSGQFDPELLVVDLELPAATATMPSDDERFGGLKIKRTIITSEPFAAYEPLPTAQAERLSRNEEIYTALVTGLRDYVHKNGFQSVLFGMSGGIDSTLVAAIAVDALGPENVNGISNPSAWSSEHSKSDAAEMAKRTGLSLDTIPIAPIFDSYQESLHLTGLAEENLQARIRAVIWMGLSNQHGHLVLACGNKSELATGYSTIYGDAVGAYAPIKDVPKTLVWELARWRNEIAVERGETPPIPEATISKPPSAELRPGQLDSDSLPPYDLLDAVLDAYVERDLGSAAVIAEGHDPALVHRVVTLVDRAEYKRRQYPPGPKVSRRNFGRDRRVPITHRWREDV
ncbi:NAD+ synthase (glutamine-hydrolyzing) [Aeromicrobium panaciterrae]|uniref:Glutamine-dependent NAD(+) synthetase n=1 Tax=Aeromicrobium panaciterrae TaxID=363861 RepID=A0ABU1UPZ2_9ACTN|nr:NAD+ synthase [Aeromicrobium panaciterrae]MDR7087248.1 NAD+ synthase (glutamine-hydrolyzing) [Aeromicrobium panaciterrae]